MKSRLAVSLLFILIASTFASDATAAFRKLRSWTGKVWSCCAVRVCNRLTARDSALMRAIKGSDNDKDGVTLIHLDGDRLLLSQTCATTNQVSVGERFRPTARPLPSILRKPRSL